MAGAAPVAPLNSDAQVANLLRLSLVLTTGTTFDAG